MPASRPHILSGRTPEHAGYLVTCHLSRARPPESRVSRARPPALVSCTQPIRVSLTGPTGPAASSLHQPQAATKPPTRHQHAPQAAHAPPACATSRPRATSMRHKPPTRHQHAPQAAHAPPACATMRRGNLPTRYPLRHPPRYELATHHPQCPPAPAPRRNTACAKQLTPWTHHPTPSSNAIHPTHQSTPPPVPHQLLAAGSGIARRGQGSGGLSDS
jgi:hypothetical protein